MSFFHPTPTDEVEKELSAEERVLRIQAKKKKELADVLEIIKRNIKHFHLDFNPQMAESFENIIKKLDQAGSNDRTITWALHVAGDLSLRIVSKKRDFNLKDIYDFLRLNP